MSNPNAIVDHCLVHKLDAETTLTLGNQKKKNTSNTIITQAYQLRCSS